MRDLPGRHAESLLQPSQTVQGAVDLAVTITHKPLEGCLSIDNRGTRFVGPRKATLMLAGNAYPECCTNITTLLHQEILGKEGTTLVLNLIRNDSQPGYTLTDLDIQSRGETVSLTLKHPWLRSRRENLHPRINLTYRNTQTRLQDKVFFDDRLRVGRVGLGYDRVDRFRGVNLADLEMSQGFPALNATERDSPLVSRSGGRSDFTKATLNLSRLQNIFGKLNLLLAAKGQYAFSSVLASEEFSVGCSLFGRGYDRRRSPETTGSPTRRRRNTGKRRCETSRRVPALRLLRRGPDPLPPGPAPAEPRLLRHGRALQPDQKRLRLPGVLQAPHPPGERGQSRPGQQRPSLLRPLRSFF